MRDSGYPQVGATVTPIDSALGRWLSARWSPPAGSRLWQLVEAIWYFDGSTGGAGERIFPDGLAELIVQFDEPYRDGDNGSAPFPALCVNGVRTRPNLVEAPAKRCRVLGIRFTAVGACLVLGLPVRELLDVTVDLRACMGVRADDLAERCAEEAGDWRRPAAAAARAVVDVAAWWCLERLDESRFAVEDVRWTAERIRAVAGLVSLEGLRAQTGRSRSEFARRFRHALGVTPKRYARILRFHRALRLLSRGEALAQVAHDLQYFDQSHMYRDFAEFAGMTPAAFVAATRFPDSVYLAE